MSKELTSFHRLNDLNQQNYVAELDKIHEVGDNFIVKLHKRCFIDDDLLKHISGIKKYDTAYKRISDPKQRGNYRKIPGSIAKHFACNQPAYAYPLFKTHKISPNDLLDISVFGIPVRLLQSAGFITTSRFTAYLEFLLQPISAAFCKYKFDEFCRDSKQYLEELQTWKLSLVSSPTCSHDQNLYIVAGDVKALYPSLSRATVLSAIRFALEHCSNFPRNCISIIIDLLSHCLDNVIVQHLDSFYGQINGIITGDNHSVSVANITLHYILLPAADTINRAVIFKRFIDDIVWLSYDLDTTNEIQNLVSFTFEENKLEVLFRRICTEENQQQSRMEFLDVEHQIDRKSVAGFFTRDYTKPTAMERTFLHGQSHHPPAVFKSIVFGKAVRLRRLNEQDETYHESLLKLRNKCARSSSNMNMVHDLLSQAFTWTERFKPKNFHKVNKPLVWASPCSTILSLTPKEKELNPNAMITYQKPSTLQTILTNYKQISLNLSGNIGQSGPCSKCALCGNFANHKNMVVTTSSFSNKAGRLFHLKQRLDCTNFGIYAARCRICAEFYVGQTKNRFSVRWSGHRTSWRSHCLENRD